MIPPAILEAVAALHAEGEGQSAIAAALRLGRHHVRRAYRELGLAPHPPTGRPARGAARTATLRVRLTPDEAARIAAAGGGAWVRELALATLDRCPHVGNPYGQRVSTDDPSV